MIGGQFNEMAEALAEQRAARVAALAGVAHDLRNPLSALKLSFSFVREDQPLPPEARLRHIIQIAERQISRLDRMVGDFLEIAKIDAGELKLEPVVAEVEPLVRRVVELLSAGERAHPITITAPSEPILLRCDPLRLEQVLINLVSNAMKYSPEASPIAIDVEARDTEVLVSVTDRGVGIAPEDQARLFDAFRRLSSTKDAAPGVGLGLYVVKKIVDAHGGHIDIRSELGRGSTFTVTLPRQEANRHETEAPRAIVH
jgi:two-component system sensor histidine kinase MtrB